MFRPSRARARHRAWLALGCAVCCLTVAARAHAAASGAVSGSVFDELERPLGNATVVVHDSRGATIASATTGADGKFHFDAVPIGDYSVEASVPGRVEAHKHLVLTSGEAAEVDLYCLVPSVVHHVVENAPTAPPPPRSSSSVEVLDRAKLQALPQGEDRPITDVVSTQPGFVLDAFGNVYARGNHANVQYQVDGIPVPDSVGNLFAQALPVRLVQSLEILTGGLPPEFGDRLAAVVNLTTRHAGLEPEGRVGLRYGSYNTTEPSLSYARQLGPVGVFVGGSYLYSQRALDPPSVTPILHDTGQSGRAFLRLDSQLSARDRLELFASYAYNRFQIPIDPTVAPLDPTDPTLVRPTDSFGNASPRYLPHDTDATETENELFATLSWVRTVNDHTSLQLAPYYKLSQGVLVGDAQHALGALADPGATASDVTRRADHAGAVLKLDWRRGGHQLKAGAQLDYLHGATDYTQYGRNDAVPSGGIDPSLTVRGTDITQSLLYGAYLQDRWDRGRLSLTGGVRADGMHVALSGDQSDDEWGVSPRLGLAFAFRPDLVAHAFVGVLWQPPAPMDASNAARALGVVPAGTVVKYDVVPETDVYGELGLDGTIRQKLRLGVAGWGRYAWNQLDDTAIGSTNLIANYNFQRGRAVGVEGKAELVIGYWLSAFANVSWLIAQGEGIASARYLFLPRQLAATAWQTLDHAQTWTANVGATVHEKQASFTVLGAYGSGLRTGPANNQTVPDHFRLDATLEYTFQDVPLKPHVALDVINVLDQHYAFRIANGFVGSSYAPPRTVFVRLIIPLGGAL